MSFDIMPAWESVTKAIYNPGGNNGKLFWQKLDAYKEGDAQQVVENGYQYKLSKRFPFQFVEKSLDQPKKRLNFFE